MPHQCTNCGRAFADGSKQMLSGCPDCGGNKFQFRPSEASSKADASDGESADGESAGSRPAEADSPRALDGEEAVDESTGAVDRAASTLSDWIGATGDTETTESEIDSASNADLASNAESAPNADPTSDAEPDDSPPEAEDRAQADARSSVVTEDDLPDDPAAPAGADDVAGASGGDVADSPDEENQPDLEQLREELNSQFESIRVVNPGQYELNLMELYEREEYVIALQEDGRYVIQVPDAWSEMDR